MTPGRAYYFAFDAAQPARLSRADALTAHRLPAWRQTEEMVTPQESDPRARRATAQIFNSAVAASAIAAAWELGALSELRGGGSLDAADFAARHDLHKQSTKGMFIALASVGVVQRDGDTVTTGPNFDEAYLAKPLFHWLARGSSSLFAQMPNLLRNTNRVGDYYQRDMEAVGFASREANATFFDPVFWSAMDRLEFVPEVVADLGSGSGKRLMQILERNPKARGIGIDIAQSALRMARTEAEKAGLDDRLEFVEADVCELDARPELAEVELVTCFMMGHDLWPMQRCVSILRHLQTVFPRARTLLIGDNVRSAGLPDDDIPVFTLAFELGHSLMDTYLPTGDEWQTAFVQTGWTCAATHQIGSLAGGVLFELVREGTEMSEQ
ncbi:class I SAM-dependent methyltransferase [Streptomyces sp. NPDC019531]|uniref:class I SAM-dependent methyltransferase n=1 Tax=Streptomyces sp. NPDC019531 TaxID=3365062 RepID=UPI00384BDE50